MWSKFIIALFLAFNINRANSHKEGCCLNRVDRPVDNATIANYDCSQLDPFGSERCNSVYNGEVCEWNYGKKCHVEAVIKCGRVPYYQAHLGKSVDVGRCLGNCKTTGTKCKPVEYYYIQSTEIDNFKFESFNLDGSYKQPDLETADDHRTLKYIKIVKSCDCSDCNVEKFSRSLEIPYGRCVGNCSQVKQTRCSAGIRDDFSTSNGLEVSSPSNLLLSNYLSQCSAGVQTGFDTFTNDRCFGHTFTGCLQQTDCNLKSGYLSICLMAAQVPLTQTDSLALGFNGSPVWGKSMVSLNGGSWNPGDKLCLTMNLDNLPIDGASILSNLQLVGHLDVAVQDDTAVDFLELVVDYEDCQKCVPRSANVNMLIANNEIKKFNHITECDCVNMEDCERHDYFVTYYPGTILEKTVNVGLCMGRCNNRNMCLPDETVPEGVISLQSMSSVDVQKIKSCKCKKLSWNSLAVATKN